MAGVGSLLGWLRLPVPLSTLKGVQDPMYFIVCLFVATSIRLYCIRVFASSVSASGA